MWTRCSRCGPSPSRPREVCLVCLCVSACRPWDVMTRKMVAKAARVHARARMMAMLYLAKSPTAPVPKVKSGRRNTCARSCRPPRRAAGRWHASTSAVHPRSGPTIRNSVPPTLSATIMTAYSKMTVQVRRSAFVVSSQEDVVMGSGTIDRVLAVMATISNTHARPR